MAQEGPDAQGHLLESQALVQRTAERLREALVQMASALAPFPYFMGSIQVQGIEVEPGSAQKPDRGCIVLCPDGELYEFTMNVQMPEPGLDLGLSREDSVKPVQLPQEEYIPYAFNAIKEVARLLEEQKKSAKGASTDRTTRP